MRLKKLSKKLNKRQAALDAFNAAQRAENRSKVSDTEFGKVRKLYVTVHHPRVKTCGHKFKEGKQPNHRNCEECWVAYFQQNGQTTATADEMYRDLGPEKLAEIQGNKFVKFFQRFMAGVAELTKNGLAVGEGTL